PMHLHGVARTQFVPLCLELGPPHSDPGQQSPLGKAPRATHEGDREGEPDQPAREDTEGEDHSRLDHDGSATPPLTSHYRREITPATEAGASPDPIPVRSHQIRPGCDDSGTQYC